MHRNLAECLTCNRRKRVKNKVVSAKGKFTSKILEPGEKNVCKVGRSPYIQGHPREGVYLVKGNETTPVYQRAKLINAAMLVIKWEGKTEFMFCDIDTSNRIGRNAQRRGNYND